MFRRVALIVAVVGLGAVAAFGARAMWNMTDRPPVSLRLALALADEEIASDRSLEQWKYFCVYAGLQKTGTNPDGEWLLHYSSADTNRLYVAIGANRKVTVSRKPFLH